MHRSLRQLHLQAMLKPAVHVCLSLQLDPSHALPRPHELAVLQFLGIGRYRTWFTLGSWAEPALGCYIGGIILVSPAPCSLHTGFGRKTMSVRCLRERQLAESACLHCSQLPVAVETALVLEVQSGSIKRATSCQGGHTTGAAAGCVCPHG